MAGRHERGIDDFRDPTGRNARGGAGARDNRDNPREKRQREDPPIGRRREDDMDVDMDDDSDEYEHARRRERDARAGKFASAARIPAPLPPTNRRDRTPPDAERMIVDAVPSRDQPRVKPGSDRDFWIPDEGIEREVITYEITRYLGQDALVRPGKNEKGRKGFLITAFRAPTTEMIRSMKEASEKYLREMSTSRTRPAAYSSSRTATGRDKDLGQYSEREPQPRRRNGPTGGYDSDDSMGDAPQVGRIYDRDYDRRDAEARHRDRHPRDQRDDLRQMVDPRYQDPRNQDPRNQDLRNQDLRTQDLRAQDLRYQQDSRAMSDPRLLDNRTLQDQRYQEPRYQDPRDLPVSNAGRHQAYTSAYADPSIPGYALSPASQPPGFDYSSAQPRYNSGNTPPPTSRAGPGGPVYVQPTGYPPVSQGAQMIIDPRTGRQLLVPAGYTPEPRGGGGRHGR